MTPHLPRSLEEGLSDGRVIPFVGAGVSMAVERVRGGRMFPSWKRLLLDGAARLEQEGKKADVVRALLEDDEEPDYLQAARKLRDKLGSHWGPFLKDAIDVSRSEVAEGSLSLARAVWSLGSRLLITTNYDQVLRWACPEEWRDDLSLWDVNAPAEQAEYLRHGELRASTVWHLHGYIGNAAGLILTPDGYASLYPVAGETEPRHQAALETLRHLLVSRSFLFVGFSLDDEHFGVELRRMLETFKGFGGTHYALVHRRDVERLRRLGSPVDLIAFEDFGEPLLELLGELARHVDPVRRKPSVPRANGSPPRAVPLYLGLNTYAKEHSEDFFGRQPEIERFIPVLMDPKVQALHLRGASGVGKSSLVIAGLLPRLGTAGGGPVWSSLYFKPGDDPFLSLAGIIDKRRPGVRQVGAEGQKRLAERMAAEEAQFVAELVKGIGPKWGEGRRVLYVDQLEELLVVDGKADLRITFVDRLRAFLAADPAHVLVSSIRTDRDVWLDERRWRVLRELLSAGRQDWIDVPEEVEGLEQIVRGPAERAGFEVDPALVKALRLDVQDVASWTPLVSATLEEIIDHWRQRDPAERVQALTLKDYKAVGGLRSVIARRANAVMEALGESERREVLPRVFSLLIKLDESGRPTRRRFAMAQVDSLGAERTLIERLVTSRLLASEGEVELVHDILFTEWEDLARWFKERSDDLDELTDLERLASRWDRRGRPETLLLPEERLERAEGALAGHSALAESNPVLSTFMGTARHRRLQEGLRRAIKEGDLKRLLSLRSAGVRLERAQFQNLDTQDAFYYALFPQEIPSPAEGAESRSGATAFNKAVGQTSEELESKLGWFTTERIHGHVNKGFSVAHYAALGGRIEILDHLLALDPGLLQKGSDGGSLPFHAAAYGGNSGAVEWFVGKNLLPAEDGVNVANTDLATALHYAASMGHAEVVATLLANGANPNATDSKGASALHYAIPLQRREVVEQFLDLPDLDLALKAPGEETLLHLACPAPASGIALLLLDHVETTALGLDFTNGEGWTALGIATAQPPTADSAQLVSKLLAKGATPALAHEPSTTSPLYLAAHWGARETLAALLSHGGVDVNATNSRGETALLAATRQQNLEVARELLLHPEIDVDRKDAQGRNPLLVAVAGGNLALVQALLARGADAARDFGRHGAIVQAVLNGADGSSRLARGQIAELLVEHGAPMPVWYQFLRDEAGRVSGLQPGLNLEAWFLDRLGNAMEEAPVLPPLLHGDWHLVETAGAAALLARAAGAGLLEELEFRGLRLHFVRSLDIALDQPTRLSELVVTTTGGEAGAIVLLSTAGRETRIDGNSHRLHQLNTDIGRKLSTTVQALEYMRLFCSAVTGEEGTFRIFDHPSQLLSRPEMGEQERARLGALAARPAPVEGSAPQQSEGLFTFDAPILYGGHVFRARLLVHSNGFIEMPEDEAIEEGTLAIYSYMFEDGILFLRDPKSQ